MKLLVASDIHGSAYFAEKLVQTFLAGNYDKLVLLGDVYNHGPRNPFPRDYSPMTVASTLGKVHERLLVIKGNCDSEVDETISNFPFYPKYTLDLNGRKLFFTHGHKFNKDSLPDEKCDAMFYGHFHTNEINVVDGVVCVAVGSVSLPKDINSFCTVDEDGITLCDFFGNRIAEYKF